MPTDELEQARHDAIHALCVAQAQGMLSVETFEQRLMLLREAPTPAAMRQIVGDLERTGDYALAEREPTAPAAPEPLQRLRLSAVFATTRRTGQWTVPLVIEGRILFGSLRLDLRDAWFDADLLEIDADIAFGSLELVVPPGTEIENEMSEMLGNSKHKRAPGRSGDWNGLLVRLSGTIFMGEVKIVERRSLRDLPEDHFRGVRGLLNRLREKVD